jgi:hypothetical protein
MGLSRDWSIETLCIVSVTAYLGMLPNGSVNAALLRYQHISAI